jgi:hypothetical protein
VFTVTLPSPASKITDLVWARELSLLEMNTQPHLPAMVKISAEIQNFTGRIESA